MDQMTIKNIALSIRTLTMDAVQKAKSGHPGLPMGLAELGALLYAEILNHNPKNPQWLNRDRFVLSAGHGSMLVYSLLHMAGYDLSLEDIKNFRQCGSKTPGHPEYDIVPGVETTTGPLGQGMANAVGMAIAEKMLAERFNTDEHKIVDHYAYAVCGDGCMMEGLTSEAASLAGHLGLGKIIVFYDSNKITIEGSTDLAFSEDVAKRYEAYGWHVQEGDAYELNNISRMIDKAKKAEDKPSIIILTSVIAKGSVNMEGSHHAHGAPLGDDEIKATRISLGVPEDAEFFIHPEVKPFFEAKQKEWQDKNNAWDNLFKDWSEKNPSLYSEWQEFNKINIQLDSDKLPVFNVGDKLSTRVASGKVLNAVAKQMSNLVGGSADLAPSNKTYLDGMGDIEKGNFKGRNFHFGIREHAMGAIVNGIALHSSFRVFCSTFFVFADYMRPAIRLASIMKIPIIYVFTHDSIYVGEDGPTHQPVEHITSLRIIPNLLVLRPADAQETVAAYKIAVEKNDGPVAIVFTRQGLEVLEKDDKDWENNIKKGAYIIKDSKAEPEIVIIATGSEVELAKRTVEKINNPNIRVLSMISRELFKKQKDSYKRNLIPHNAKKLVIEAGVSFGWGDIAGADAECICVDRFGESGPYPEVAKHFGFSTENVIEKLKKLS